MLLQRQAKDGGGEETAIRSVAKQFCASKICAITGFEPYDPTWKNSALALCGAINSLKNKERSKEEKGQVKGKM
jgi:hypothetical protein